MDPTTKTRASRIIEEAERQAQDYVTRTGSDAGSRCAYLAGTMIGWVKTLCDEIEALQSAEGIAASVAMLPTRIVDFKTVLQAMHDRLAAEDELTDLESVQGHIEDAITSMDDCHEMTDDEKRAEADDWHEERMVDEMRDAA